MKAYITHLAYELPCQRVENPVGRLRKKTGIRARHITSADETAGDLAARVAEKLFATGVDRQNVDFLLLCTQSPDYLLPTTACILQNRLGLSSDCGAMDFNLGCSGYVYGLGLAKGLIETGQARCVLLLTSETYSKYIHPRDGATSVLFGDGATATLIERRTVACPGIYGMTYGTDGRGAKELIVPIGGSRHPYATATVEEMVDVHGNYRTNRNLYMNGSAIMNFALDVVPKGLDEVLKKGCLRKEDIDYYVFHQANRFMLNYLQQECGLSDKPYWNDVEEYGNTVSNSIPIALYDLARQRGVDGLRRIVLMGFGVGLSWGGCIVDLTSLKISGE